MVRVVVVAVSLVVAGFLSSGCHLLFANGAACDAGNPATCPSGTTCVEGTCVAGDNPPPGAPGPFCGDGKVDDGEACDDGNSDNGDGCHVDCTLPACGDGFTDPGEQCDDGNTTAGDGCDADCRFEAAPAAVCGDGVVNGTEDCDFAATPDTCNTDCTAGSCGDGKIDGDEECDDGNDVDGDGCSGCVVDTPVGVVPVCGDGVVNGTEDCDFAATPDTCNTDCTAGSCGDGKIDGDEECDDGNAVDGDGCSGCVIDTPAGPTPFCGDGIVNNGEACDLNDPSGGPCNDDCTASVCGDGKRGPDEECDETVAAFVGGLDGTSNDSTFETGDISELPAVGWTELVGQARVDDGLGFSGVLIADNDFDNYEVQYATGEAVEANRTYTLHLDLGFVSGGVGGGIANFDVELGTLGTGTRADVFTPLGKRGGAVVNIGNLASGPTPSASLDLVVKTGGAVNGEQLAVRFGQRGTDGVDSFFGIDNVTLRKTDRCEATCTFEPDPFCGDGIVTAGEDCDGGDGCTADCHATPPCPGTIVGGFCQVDVAGSPNSRVPRLADLNGDGLNDLITTASEAQLLFVQLQTTPGRFGAVRVTNTTLKGRIMETGDVDGDGDIDIVLGGNGSGNALEVVRNDGFGNLTVEAPFNTDVDDTREFDLVDLDGDGDLDICVGAFNSDGIALLRNDGTGNFVFDPTTFANDPAGNGVVATAIADFDGDGDLDTVTGNFSTANVSVYLCDATGDCNNGTALAAIAGATNVGSVGAGDVDGDGKADIVASSLGAGAISFFKGNGDGTFLQSIAVGASTNPDAFTVKDIDGDGRNEIVTTSGPDASVEILSHVSGSTFLQQNLPCPGPSEVRVGDANGDGRNDLACTRPAAGVVRVFFTLP